MRAEENRYSHETRHIFQTAAAGLVLLAALFWCFPVHAGQQRSAQFTVDVLLTTGNQPGAPLTGFCTKTTGSGVFGSTITYACSTGSIVDISPDTTGMPWVPMHGGAYRYVTNIYSSAGTPLGTVDSYAGIGTITTWRVVQLADRDYLEMMVLW